MLHYDDRLPSDRKERREAFITLLGNLSDHGYGKEEINSSRKEKIIKSCVNPNHKNKSKLRKWVSIIVNDLEAALIIFYPTIKIRDNIVTEEMSSKLAGMERKAEEQRALKTVDDNDSEEESDGTFSLEDHTPLDIRDAIENPIAPKQEEFEITDDMLDEMDGPEVVYDPNFMKKLGLE